jgi:hypothetical protein
VVALFAFLVGLAVYFWGALLFGGVLDVFSRQRTPVPWSLGDGEASTPEHDIDPGLELLAAGMLVYRVGDVKPQPYFRHVPLADARAIRPFIVARSGVPNERRFTFRLDDERNVTRFRDGFHFPLRDAPKVVMPPYRLVIERPQDVAGQRWTLRVRSGVTVVSTFRFRFANGRVPQAATVGSGDTEATGSETWRQTDLSRLLDEAVKRDAMTQTQDFVLEDG